MKKNPSVMVAILTLSAIILGVVLLATPNREARGMMLNNQPGLVMMTGGPLQGGDELLVILDRTTGKMLVYHLVNNAFELVGSENVSTLFQPSTNIPQR